MMTTTAARPAVQQPESPHRGWTRWVGYATALWAGVYSVLALVWTLTGAGYPFHLDDPEAGASLLRHIPPGVGAPVAAGVLLATSVAALAMTGRHGVRLRGAPRRLLLAFGWAVAAALLVIVPDVTLLALTGYAPMLILGAPFGWPPQVHYADVFTWLLANQVCCLFGGFLLAATVLAWQRWTRGDCAACGRSPAGAPPRTAAVDRWGRWATYVAVVIPLIYAATRYAWLIGVPLGISQAQLRELQESKAVWAGAGLATFAVMGAVLTLGLIQRWGEVFPRWLVGLAGRRVPVKLAVIPASYVAAVVVSAGLALPDTARFWHMLANGEWLILPHLLWPVWGVALGMATYAYYLRRRGRCATCGQGGAR